MPYCEPTARCINCNQSGTLRDGTRAAHSLQMHNTAPAGNAEGNQETAAARFAQDNAAGI